VDLKIVSPLNGGQDKNDFVNLLGGSETIAIGNGFNDIGMLGAAGLSIVIMGQEGCSVDALKAARIAVRDIRDALDLLLEPRRLIATLRA
jgi:soluble P-type ATPase